MRTGKINIGIFKWRKKVFYNTSLLKPMAQIMKYLINFIMEICTLYLEHVTSYPMIPVTLKGC